MPKPAISASPRGEHELRRRKNDKFFSEIATVSAKFSAVVCVYPNWGVLDEDNPQNDIRFVLACATVAPVPDAKPKAHARAR